MGSKTIAACGCVLVFALLVVLAATVYINRQTYHMLAMLEVYRTGKRSTICALLDRIDPTCASPLQYAYWQHEMGKGFVGMDRSELVELFGPPCRVEFRDLDGLVQDMAPKTYDEILHYGEDNHAGDHHVGDETENLFFFLDKGKVVAVKTLFP